MLSIPRTIHVYPCLLGISLNPCRGRCSGFVVLTLWCYSEATWLTGKERGKSWKEKWWDKQSCSLFWVWVGEVDRILYHCLSSISWPQAIWACKYLGRLSVACLFFFRNVRLAVSKTLHQVLYWCSHLDFSLPWGNLDNSILQCYLPSI